MGTVARAKTNAQAAGRLLRRLRRRETLGDLDEARELAFMTLAKALDADPTNAALHREYRMTEILLRTAEDSVDDDYDAFLAKLSAPVRDPKDA